VTPVFEPGFPLSARRLSTWWHWLQVRGEQMAVNGICVLFLVVQLNNIRHHAYWGQDRDSHQRFTELVFDGSGRWLFMDATNRPLVYWIGGICRAVTHDRHTYELAALFFVGLCIAALQLLHSCLREISGSAPVRILALAFVGFLPVTIITSVVYAADTAAIFPFALLAWSLIRSLQDASPERATGYALLACLALCLGNLAKILFLVLSPAVLLLALLLWRRGNVPGRRAAMIGLVVAVVPAIFGGWICWQSRLQLREVKPRHTFDWRGTGEMTWRSLLWVRRADLAILQAPGYWDSSIQQGKSVRPPLLEDNRYSYPALLALGIFTDVMDIANNGSLDDGQAPRPEPQKSLSCWAIRGGVIFFGLTFLAVAANTWRIFSAVFWRGRPPSVALTVWMVLAFAWSLPVVAALPFVHHAYDWGYWLPRLVLPSVWGFAVVLFAALDRVVSHRPRWKALLAIAVLAQCAVQVGSVWY